MPVPPPYHTSAVHETLESLYAVDYVSGADKDAALTADKTKAVLLADRVYASGLPSLSRPVSAAGPGEVAIAVLGISSADLTRDLYGWLTVESGLRGRVRIVENDAPTCALGTADIALQAALGSGGAVTALVTVAIAWLRVRTGKVTISFSSCDGKRTGSLSVTAVKNLEIKDIRDLVTQVAEILADDHCSENEPECDPAQNDAA